MEVWKMNKEMVGSLFEERVRKLLSQDDLVKTQEKEKVISVKELNEKLSRFRLEVSEIKEICNKYSDLRIEYLRNGLVRISEGEIE
jgi:hypothetical protein